MRGIALTQSKVALVDDEDYETLTLAKWMAVRNGNVFYAVHGYCDNRRHTQRVLMHRLILNAPPGLEVDHRNGDGLDNRKANLRLATHRLNGQNRRHVIRPVCPDLPIGVYRSRNKFRATTRCGGWKGHLGTFDTIEEAQAAYLAARDEAIARETEEVERILAAGH